MQGKGGSLWAAATIRTDTPSNIDPLGGGGQGGWPNTYQWHQRKGDGDLPPSPALPKAIRSGLICSSSLNTLGVNLECQPWPVR